MTDEQKGVCFANRLILILTVLLFLGIFFMESCNAQVLYATEYKWEKDVVKVFETKNKWQADKIVYYTDRKSEAKNNIVYWSSNKWEADRRIYFVTSRYRADEVWYITKYKWQVR